VQKLRYKPKFKEKRRSYALSKNCRESSKKRMKKKKGGGEKKKKKEKEKSGRCKPD